MIPGTKQLVTVTLSYTDESIAAEGVGSDSMLLSLAIADRKLDDAPMGDFATKLTTSSGWNMTAIRAPQRPIHHATGD